MPYRPLETFICPICIEEEELARLIRNHLEPGGCTYCGREGAAPAEVIQEAVLDAIAFQYTDPAEVLPYESREGGYQGQVVDGGELVWEVLQPPDSKEKNSIIIDIAKSFVATSWAKKDYFGMDDYEVLQFGWDEFVEQVKHRTRYLFREVDERAEYRTPQEIPPSHMLEELGKLIRDFDLFIILNPDTDLFRARIHSESEVLETPAELGSPPREVARLSNRMSPAGIPMFYGALDRSTAVVETLDPRLSYRTVTIGTFHSNRPLRLVDLTTLPSLPSLFDEEARYFRNPIRFLRDFVTDLTKPIQRDGWEHVEYVPTQIVTEFIRHPFSREDEGIDGLLYRSSRPDGERSVVLFFENSDCGPRTDRESWQDEPTLLLTAHERGEATAYLP